MEENFFVGIYEPLDVRRNLLESSKELIRCLQAYERLEKIRNEKLKYYKEMKRISSELDLLVNKLKQKLPQTGIRKMHKTDHKQIVLKEITRNEITSPKLKSDMQKLQEQLQEIEGQLKNMK